MVSLAHLSDPHLPLPPGDPPLRSLTGKQLLAFLAWRRKRRHVTSAAVLDALAADLAAHAPDRVAVTGDLVNLATPPELDHAARWAARLGPSGAVCVVPGNHDRTRPAPLGQPEPSGVAQWNDFGGAGPFPTLLRVGPAAIIGLSSGVPTRMFSASGLLGPAQLDRADDMLRRLGEEKVFRIVLIHHPPVIGEGGRRKALRDRAAVSDILRRRGAELVLHGHHHRSRLTSLPGPCGPIPVIGVPSASASVARPEPAGWNLYRIEETGPGWRLTTTTRRYDPHERRFKHAGEWFLDLSRPVSSCRTRPTLSSAAGSAPDCPLVEP